MIIPEIYEALKECQNENGIPIMDKPLFVAFTDRYGKADFRETLHSFMVHEQVEYPYKDISEERVEKLFSKLRDVDIKTNIHFTHEKVIEKFVYKYPYTEYGLGYIQCGHSYNDISDYFHQRLRLDCPYMGGDSPVQRWQAGNVKGELGALWRNVNNQKRLDLSAYRMMMRLGSYIATQFKPNVATVVYNMTKAKKVLDTSMGWGDRLAGFFASEATHYIGCDPNPNTFKKYKEQVDFYNKLTGNQKKVDLYCCGAEDLPWKNITDIDVAFTSPPYFSTETYNKGGEGEENQSWKKFPEYRAWMEDFLLHVSEKTLASLKPDGFFMLNIMDPKIKGKRLLVCDELVDTFRDQFLGQIGMRISQRPQGKSVFGDGEGGLDKEKLNEYMSKSYIENIWCFGDKEQDIFRGIRESNLDNFFK